MCKRGNIWEHKTRIRKYLSLKNRTIVLIEYVQEKENISFEEATDRLFEDVALLEQTKKEVEESYPTYKN